MPIVPLTNATQRAVGKEIESVCQNVNQHRAPCIEKVFSIIKESQVKEAVYLVK